MHRPARLAGIAAIAAALAACGTASLASVAAAAPSKTAGAAAAGSQAAAVRTIRYFAFDINNGGADPGFIPAPGTSPNAFAQGDELIINAQLTSTHKVKGGFPIVGHDAGVCTLTRIPEPHARQTLANCVVTAVVSRGSLTIQGIIRFRSRQPQPTVLAVTGGTGRFSGATGAVSVSFTKDFEVLTFRLK